MSLSWAFIRDELDRPKPDYETLINRQQFLKEISRTLPQFTTWAKVSQKVNLPHSPLKDWQESVSTFILESKFVLAFSYNLQAYP